MRFFSILAIIALAGVITYRSLPESGKHLHGSAMGTTWNLQWRTEGQQREVLLQNVSQTLEKWEQVLSQWREGSDLSRFNRGEPASDDLQRVIELAAEMRVQTGGAYDPRLLRETADQGFGPPGEGMDLSGIGKGFAVDRVAEVLVDLGLEDFIFELGGEVVAVGGEWEVGIEAPLPSGSMVSRKIKLKDQALATSGNYRQFKPAANGLAGHIIDPESRKPVVRQLSSVSVIARDCATADAWATALFVLGPEFPVPDGIEAFWNEVPETDAP